MIVYRNKISELGIRDVRTEIYTKGGLHINDKTWSFHGLILNSYPKLNKSANEKGTVLDQCNVEGLKAWMNHSPKTTPITNLNLLSQNPVLEL